MRVFVTGGSGFVGGHVSEALAAEHEVLAMARSERSAAKVAAFGATPVRCSLEDIGPGHLDGVDAVVHAAAFVEEWGTAEDFFAANVGGTEAVLAAARAAGVLSCTTAAGSATWTRARPTPASAGSTTDDPRPRPSAWCSRRTATA